MISTHECFRVYQQLWFSLIDPISLFFISWHMLATKKRLKKLTCRHQMMDKVINKLVKWMNNGPICWKKLIFECHSLSWFSQLLKNRCIGRAAALKFNHNVQFEKLGMRLKNPFLQIAHLKWPLEIHLSVTRIFFNTKLTLVCTNSINNLC